MSDSLPPEPNSPEAASPPRPAQPLSEEPAEPVPTDFRRNAWLLIIILGVVVIAWLMAILWRRIPQPTQALQQPQDPAPAPAERVSRPRRAVPVEVSRMVGSGTEAILAAPAVVLPHERTPYRLQRLFDVTRRAEGFAPSALLRLPNSWLDRQPVLSVAEGASPGFVPLGGLVSPGPEARLVLLQTPDGMRAYPVALFLDCVAVRDRIGNRSVLIAWSAFSQTARCLVSNVNGLEINWGDSGLIHRGDDVLYDVETGSLWDTYSGRALTGPMADARAPSLPVAVWPWAACQERYPDTLVPDLQPGKDVPDAEKKRMQDTLDAYLGASELPFDLPHFDPAQSALPAKAFVLGVQVAGEARAYPIGALAEAGVNELTDSLGGATYLVHITSPRTAYATCQDGQVEAVVRLWFAWKETYPETSLYAPPSERAPS